MIDNKHLRDNLDSVAEKLTKKQFKLDKEQYHALETKRKTLQSTTEQLQAQRNQSCKAIGIAKSKGEDTQTLMTEAQRIAKEMGTIEQELKAHQEKLQMFTLGIPNVPHDSVPEGASEADNVPVKTWSEPRTFDFPVKDHIDLTHDSGCIDFELGATLATSRFAVLRSEIALLNRALIQFMLDTHTQRFGYEEINTPVIVKSDALFGTGQMPKFHDDQFWLDDERELALIPTAEVTLTNLIRNNLLTQDQLPLKFCAHSLCFRKEAGSYGKDTRGILRMHQFEKIELVQITHPDTSYDALDELTSHAEYILEQLNLPYRRVALCTADLGFSAAKTYDLEVWIPSQNTYREISSCSNTEDFQARRMKARLKLPNKKNVLPHTLNGSGLAVGRTVLAILENHQESDGSITIPSALAPYMHGKTSILKKEPS